MTTPLPAAIQGLVDAANATANWKGECGSCGEAIEVCDKTDQPPDPDFPGCPGPSARAARAAWKSRGRLRDDATLVESVNDALVNTGVEPVERREILWATVLDAIDAVLFGERPSSTDTGEGG